MPTKASAAPAPPGAPAPTPYEEHHHYRFRHPDVKNTVKARQRSFRAIQVERDNTHIQRRLNELRREPASRFHAPDGELSLVPKSQRTYGPRAAPRRRPEWDDGGGRSSSTSLRDGGRRKNHQNPSSPAGGKTQTKERRARHWPPPRFPRGVYAENTEVMRQNASLQRRLVNQYRASRDSQLVREGKGRPVDGLALWAKRLAVYDPHPPNRARTTDARTGKCVSTGVPKTLTVARCSATGLLTYFGADGHRLREHPDCPGLYYCEKWFDEFAEMDATMQRAVIDYAIECRSKRPKERSWQPARAPGESWVVNRHMKLSLILMRRMARADLFENASTLNASNVSGDDRYEDDFEDEGDAPVRSAAGTTRAGTPLTMDEIRRRVETCRLRERIDDEERRRERREIEKLGRDEAVAAAAAAPRREEIAAEGRAEAEADADATDADATGV